MSQLEGYLATLNGWLAEADVRVRDWPLMNFWVMLSVAGAYLATVAVLVFVMKRREKPFTLRGFMIFHNLHLVVLSGYMCFEILNQAIRGGYSLFGNGVDTSEAGLPMARILWVFYVSKVAEFIDTFIMALKKNFRQITFLHVYHHVSIFFIWWIIVSYAPGGEAYFSAALNSFIHVVMYSYYLWSMLAKKPADKAAAAEDGKKKRATPCEPAYWKQMVTNMQLTQFTVMFIQASYDLVVPNPYPRFCAQILFYYMMTMLLLFGNFYLQTYLKGAAKKKQAVKKDN